MVGSSPRYRLALVEAAEFVDPAGRAARPPLGGQRDPALAARSEPLRRCTDAARRLRDPVRLRVGQFRPRCGSVYGRRLRCPAACSAGAAVPECRPGGFLSFSLGRRARARRSSHCHTWRQRRPSSPPITGARGGIARARPARRDCTDGPRARRPGRASGEHWGVLSVRLRGSNGHLPSALWASRASTRRPPQGAAGPRACRV